MSGFFYFPNKYNFMSLFTSIWIKNHFPLKSPIADFFQVFTSFPADTLITWIGENKDVSSANNEIFSV